MICKLAQTQVIDKGIKTLVFITASAKMSILLVAIYTATLVYHYLFFGVMTNGIA